MSNEIIVGLDIGTTKIACFIGQATENGKIKIFKTYDNFIVRLYNFANKVINML